MNQSNREAIIFNEVIDEWLASYQLGVKASSFARTEEIVEKYFRPTLGLLHIQSISTELCQKTIDQWVDLHSYARYSLFVNYLRRIFQFAMFKGIITKNPLMQVLVPVKKEEKNKPRLKFYTKDELQLFLSTILQHKQNDYLKSRDYMLFRLLAYSGCRIGELLALNWEDLNFTTTELSIHKTVTKSKRYYVSPTPKTEKSQRIILLDKQTIDYLKDWQQKQQLYLQKRGFERANFLFTNGKNQFTINQAVTERYKIYQEAAQLEYIGLHGFRHTHASLLFEAGADYKDVQERLGHENIHTTMDIYTHLSKQRQYDTIERFSQYINN